MKKENKRQDFRPFLGFKEHDIFKRKESSIIEKIQTVFSAEKILLQYSVFTYRIDIYFPDHKLAVEIDKIGHQNRDVNCEIQRQKVIEKELNCKIIRINPDKENFNFFVEISKIQNHITESTKKLIKKTIIDDASSELLVLEFTKKQFNKNKVFQIYC